MKGRGCPQTHANIVVDDSLSRTWPSRSFFQIQIYEGTHEREDERLIWMRLSPTLPSLCWCRCAARRSPLLVKLRFMGKINISLTYHRHFKRRLFIIRWHQRHRRGRRGGCGKGPRENFFPVFFFWRKEETGTPNLLVPLCIAVVPFGVFPLSYFPPSVTEAGLLLLAWSDLCTLYCLQFQKEGYELLLA